MLRKLLRLPFQLLETLQSIDLHLGTIAKTASELDRCIKPDGNNLSHLRIRK
jgi:hypothetical protein